MEYTEKKIFAEKNKTPELLKQNFKNIFYVME